MHYAKAVLGELGEWLLLALVCLLLAATFKYIEYSLPILFVLIFLMGVNDKLKKDNDMSETMTTIGHMALLVIPVGDHTNQAWEDKQEWLYANNHKLELNYEGTMVFSTEISKPSYDVDGLHIVKPGGHEKFIEACTKAGLAIHDSTIKPFFCNWYNGADSPMSDLTKDEFLKE